jgi:hypothetical protein
MPFKQIYPNRATAVCTRVHTGQLENYGAHLVCVPDYPGVMRPYARLKQFNRL